MRRHRDRGASRRTGPAPHPPAHRHRPIRVVPPGEPRRLGVLKLPGLGVELSFTALDRTGSRWAFDLSGAFTATSAGLKRSDALWKALGTAAVLHSAAIGLPLPLLTTAAPSRPSTGMLALEAVTGPDRPVHDVVELLDPAGHRRLRVYASPGGSEPGSR